jgi:hypothetical protein
VETTIDQERMIPVKTIITPYDKRVTAAGTLDIRLTPRPLVDSTAALE